MGLSLLFLSLQFLYSLFPSFLSRLKLSVKLQTTHSEDPNSGASSSSTIPQGGDFEGGGEQREGNNYEVFLSFRGQDTRKGFTSHLYTRLSNAGIQVFIDKRDLPTGEPFGPELSHAIKRSKISIPIISENYAFSKWCLRELVHMLKCRRNGEQRVVPIFYKVKPSQVRYLKGRLRDEFIARNENVDGIDFKEWEDALEEVSKLKALESEEIDNGNEGTLVEMIFRKVMLELKRRFLLNVPKQLVGIDDRVERIMRLINAEFNGARIIGIYGMGGIGKTTLAKVLYNRLSSRFDCHSSVEDIRETSQGKGIVGIQNQLISDLIENFVGVSNVGQGIGVITSLVKKNNVLILLDDMDDDTHLNALVGDRSWFLAGSVIIITTRNKSILDKVEARLMYQVNELHSDQSLILFSRHALRMDSPPTEYEVISRDIVSTTRGLPLTLEIIGSFLCGKTKEAWKATSRKLEKVPHKKVQEKLRISYDALDLEDQHIFLDIACFFIGSSNQYPTYMWDACDFYPGKGIEVLSLLSLIKIDNNGKLLMHDQLRDMGREIVRLENEKKPGKRSRLWNYDDAVEVLGSNKGTSKIEALRLNNWGRSLTAEQLKELTNLRFLHVNRVNFTGDFQNLLPRLRWLQWNFYALDFEATNFCPKKLVVLDLSRTKISEDWGGWDTLKRATELKVLNLSYCFSLTTTPDLSTFKRLEIMILEGCGRLKEIHPSLGVIKSLVSLNVKHCLQLKELPEYIGRMKELGELLLDCTAIREIPISRGYLTKLQTLSASNCQRLAQLPESIGSLESLIWLYLSCTVIKELPESIGSLKKLETLDASYCTWLAHIPSAIGDLPSLSLLNLSHCGRLAQLPDSIGDLPSLSLLNLSHCDRLAQLPDSIGHLPSLSLLDLSHCRQLAQLPDSMGSLTSLKRLLLSDCRSLIEIPDSIGKLTLLTELDLRGSAIVELPDSIWNMQDLSILRIYNYQSPIETRLFKSDAIKVLAN